MHTHAYTLEGLTACPPADHPLISSEERRLLCTALALTVEDPPQSVTSLPKDEDNVSRSVGGVAGGGGGGGGERENQEWEEVMVDVGYAFLFFYFFQ